MLDGRGAHFGAIAGEDALLGLYACGRGDAKPHEADRLLGAAAAGTRYAGDGNGIVDPVGSRRALQCGDEGALGRGSCGLQDEALRCDRGARARNLGGGT